MAAVGTGNETRILAYVFAIIYAYLLYSWIADTGVIPWFEYGELRLIGSYTPLMTPIAVLIFVAPVFAMIMSSIVSSAIRFVRFVQSRMRFQASRPITTNVRPLDKLSTVPRQVTASQPQHAPPPRQDPVPPQRPAYQPPFEPSFAAPAVVKPQQGPAKAMLILGLVSTAIAVGFGMVIYLSATGSYVYEPVDLAKGEMPRTSHVALIGVEHPEMQVEIDASFKTSESTATYVPLLPPHWTREMPVTFFLELKNTSGGDGDFRVKDGSHASVSQPTGRLGHLPGVAAYAFMHHGIILGSPHYTLKSEAVDADSLSFGIVVISSIMALSFLLTGLGYFFANRRTRSG